MRDEKQTRDWLQLVLPPHLASRVFECRYCWKLHFFALVAFFVFFKQEKRFLT